MTQSRYAELWSGIEEEITNNELSHQIEKSIPVVEASAQPGINDSIFALYGVVVHAVLSEVMIAAHSAPHDPTLQYIEAGRSIVTGVQQLRDEETHRPIVTKVKGFTNVTTGVGLAVLTGICTTLGTAAAVALSAQGLAAGLGIAFVMSCDEVIRTARKGLDPEYWLVDSIKQWDKLNQQTIPTLREDIHKLKNTPWINENAAAAWALNRKIKRLEQLEKLAQELEKDIKDRTTTNQDCWNAYKKHFMLADPKSALSIKAQQLIGYKTTELSKSGKKDIEDRVNAKCKKECKEAVSIALLTGIAFVGALLLCIPGAQLIGVILIGIAATLAAAKHAKSIKEEAPKIKKQAVDFFRSRHTIKENHEKGKEIELQPLSPPSRGGGRPT